MRCGYCFVKYNLLCTADSEWTVRHRFPYDHNATPEANLQKAVERLNGMEEYRTETAERSAIHR